MVQAGVVMSANIAARENLFEVLEERGIDGHHVFEVPVNGAVFDHQDFSIAFDHLSLDLARPAVHQFRKRTFPIQNLLANFRDAART